MENMPGQERLGRAMATIAATTGLLMGHEVVVQDDYAPAATTSEIIQSDCYEPTAADYAGVDAALATNPMEDRTPVELMDRIRGEDDGLFTDAELHDRGVHSFNGKTADTIDKIVPAMVNGSSEDYYKRADEHKAELFDAFRQTAINQYGMRIELLDKTIITAGNEKDQVVGAQEALPVTFDDLTANQIISAYRMLSSIPAEYFSETKEQAIILYKPKFDKKGVGAAGFTYLDGKIYLGVEYSDALPHELGHESDRTTCTDIHKDQAFSALNDGLNIYDGPNHEQTPSLKTFETEHGQEVQKIRFGNEEDYADNKPLAEARCQVDEAYADESKKVASVSDYHTNVGEDKAEIYGAILGSDNISTLLDRCKPIIAAKTRLILGRLYHIAPKTTAFIISRFSDHERPIPRPADMILPQNDQDTDARAFYTGDRSMK